MVVWCDGLYSGGGLYQPHARARKRASSPAHRSRRAAIGCEKDPTYYLKLMERVRREEQRPKEEGLAVGLFAD